MMGERRWFLEGAFVFAVAFCIGIVVLGGIFLVVLGATTYGAWTLFLSLPAVYGVFMTIAYVLETG
jgi:MFS superfamily sulfate permease-like transporter